MYGVTVLSATYSKILKLTYAWLLKHCPQHCVLPVCIQILIFATMNVHISD